MQVSIFLHNLSKQCERQSHLVVLKYVPTAMAEAEDYHSMKGRIVLFYPWDVKSIPLERWKILNKHLIRKKGLVFGY